MKVTDMRMVVCILALCVVTEISCKAIPKGVKKKVSLNKSTPSPKIDVIPSKPKLQPTAKMDPSGHETDVDDVSDLLIHDRKELKETGRDPCGKSGVTCRRRKKRQFSKLLAGQPRSSDGVNRVYDLQVVGNRNVDKSTPPNLIIKDDDYDDDDDDGDGHMVMLRQRRDSGDSDDIGDDSSYSDLSGLEVHSEDGVGFRHKRDTLSDLSLSDDSDDDEDDVEDDDFAISSDDSSLSLLKNKVKRDTDGSSLDTFEEENDEIFDDVDDDEDESVKSDVILKTSEKRQQRGITSNKMKPGFDKHDKTSDITNKTGKTGQQDSTQTTQVVPHNTPETKNKHTDDDTSSSNAKNSGPETESDADLSDIPLDPFDVQPTAVLSRVPRDSSDMSHVTTYEEGADPNSGYQDWEAWDPCSVTCGVGRSTRRRVCIDTAHCKGGDVEIEACMLNGEFEC